MEINQNKISNKDLNKKTTDKDKDTNKIKLINWEEFIELKDQDSNLQFYSLNDKNSISDMQFYLSKETTSHIFLSKII